MTVPEDFYSLKPLGFSQYAISRRGEIWSLFSDRLLVPQVHRCNYLIVNLKNDYGVSRPCYIHRLVAKMFVPTEDTTLQIDHIDGNKHNNCVDNLRWVTNRENAHAAMTLGLMPHAVFNDEQVHYICKRLEEGAGVAVIQRELGVPTRASIDAIRLKRNWTHISSLYNIPNPRKRKCMDEEMVRFACQGIVYGWSDKELGIILGVDPTLIHRIRIKTNFEEISKEYF